MSLWSYDFKPDLWYNTYLVQEVDGGHRAQIQPATDDLAGPWHWFVYEVDSGVLVRSGKAKAQRYAKSTALRIARRLAA